MSRLDRLKFDWAKARAASLASQAAHVRSNPVPAFKSCFACGAVAIGRRAVSGKQEPHLS